MREETSEKRSSGTGWVMGMVAALLFYILAPGPVCLLLEKRVINEKSFVWRMFIIGWDPIEKLINNAKPAKQFYRAYFKVLGINTPL